MEYINVFAVAKKLYDNQDEVKAKVGLPSASKKPVLKGSVGPTIGLIGILIGIIVISLLFLVVAFFPIWWNVTLLIKHWKHMPPLAAYTAFALLLTGFIPFSIILIYAAKA